MRSDITRWSRGCLVCTTREAGRAYCTPLTPIPVSGLFDRIGVDSIQFPRSHQGNMDYLTKWPEVFPVPDQSAATVARLLIAWRSSRGSLRPRTCLSLGPDERSRGAAGVPQGKYLGIPPANRWSCGIF